MFLKKKGKKTKNAQNPHSEESSQVPLGGRGQTGKKTLAGSGEDRGKKKKRG